VSSKQRGLGSPVSFSSAIMTNNPELIPGPLRNPHRINTKHKNRHNTKSSFQVRCNRLISAQPAQSLRLNTTEYSRPEGPIGVARPTPRSKELFSRHGDRSAQKVVNLMRAQIFTTVVRTERKGIYIYLYRYIDR
jgi:hypothetical protein